MNRNQEQAAKMYPGLRRRIRDEFGSSAFINKFDAYSHLQGREQYYSFVAYVEIFGRTVAGHGRNENEIFDSIVHNYENGYSVSSATPTLPSREGVETVGTMETFGTVMESELLGV